MRLGPLALVLVLAGCSSSANTASRDAPTTESTTESAAYRCRASMDAARAGSAVFYVNHGHFPTTFAEMTHDAPADLTLERGSTARGTTMTGPGWTLTMSGGGVSTAPTFACSPAFS